MFTLVFAVSNLSVYVLVLVLLVAGVKQSQLQNDGQMVHRESKRQFLLTILGSMKFQKGPLVRIIVPWYPKMCYQSLKGSRKCIIQNLYTKPPKSENQLDPFRLLRYSKIYGFFSLPYPPPAPPPPLEWVVVNRFLQKRAYMRNLRSSRDGPRQKCSNNGGNKKFYESTRLITMRSKPDYVEFVLL